jgi:hypothetical protein
MPELLPVSLWGAPKLEKGTDGHGMGGRPERPLEEPVPKLEPNEKVEGRLVGGRPERPLDKPVPKLKLGRGSEGSVLGWLVEPEPKLKLDRGGEG